MLPKVLCLAVIVTLSAHELTGPADKVFSLPDSVVLFGNYNDLRVVGPDWRQQLRPPVDEGYNRGYFAYPSITPRGDAVAWGFASGWEEKRPLNRARFTLGLYSLADNKWKTQGDFDMIGSVAYSPSGSKVAFVAARDGREDLLIFDVQKERMTQVPYPRGGLRAKVSMSWAPDETRLAVQIQEGGTRDISLTPKAEAKRTPAIGVLELKDGSVRLIGGGLNPAWSPTGEWIAYFDPSGEKCLVIRPDGTAVRTITTAKDSWFSSRTFGGTAPVWSPDGKQLLLNVVKNDGPSIDVVLVDLLSGRTITKSRSGLLVFGWARSHRSQ